MHVALRRAAVPGWGMALRLPSVLLQHHEGPGCALPGVRSGAAPPASVRFGRQNACRWQHAQFAIDSSTRSRCSGLRSWMPNNIN